MSREIRQPRDKGIAFRTGRKGRLARAVPTEPRVALARLLGAAAVISLLLGGIPAVAAPPPESQAAKAPARLTATIRAVDSKAGTLELFTGVGHALRLVRMQVDPTSRIKAAGAPAGLGDLKPGRIVRIEYGVSAERSLALTIETVEPESAGGTR